MPAIPFIPETAPFSAYQRLWLNGYLAGYFSAGGEIGAEPGAGSAAVAAAPLLVLYGSQTGTSEALAKRVAKEAGSRGFAPRTFCMDQHAGLDLTKEQNLLIVTSTYGDGEPPDNALGFWTALNAEPAADLSQLHFSVLALGDTNYPAFCEFGKKCDARLEALGAKRVHPRADCDVDYEEPAKAWLAAVLGALPRTGASNASAPAALPAAAEAAPVGYSRQNPFPARLLTNRLLNAPGSSKEVRHFEISLDGSGLEYEVGDALGVLPTNCPALVAEILSALGCDGEEAAVASGGGETSLRQALLQQYDINRPTPDLLKAVAERGADSELCALLDPARKDDLKKWLWGREIIDLLARASVPFTAAEFIALLKKLQPRLYSISSSPKAHPGEVHLTVGAVRYESHGRPRKGVCSTFLADRCAIGPDSDAGGNRQAHVPVFVQKSHGFRLPADLSRPVIMVGPGTGIAPFRAFLEERRATSATGANWLFFGDQRRDADFLYREEMEAMLAEGSLARLDLAFSRDQADKIYVQQRMVEAAAELWQWLENGAHFYVCGDASRMAKDVDAALHQVAEKAGGLAPEAAADYVAKLKADKRYQRDVY